MEVIKMSYDCKIKVFVYCSKGDFFNIVNQEGGVLNERRALKYAYQILFGLEHMHRNGVAHRDLSLENVLVNDNGECQICDFGLVASISSVRSECVFKLFYMHRKCLQFFLNNPAKADSWSMGVILFILLTGHAPFSEASQKDNGFHVSLEYGVERLVRMWKMDSSMSPETLDLLTSKSICASFNDESYTMIIRTAEFRRTSSMTKIMSKFVKFFKRKPKKTSRACRSIGLNENVLLQKLEYKKSTYANNMKTILRFELYVFSPSPCIHFYMKLF